MPIVIWDLGYRYLRPWILLLFWIGCADQPACSSAPQERFWMLQIPQVRFGYSKHFCWFNSFLRLFLEFWALLLSQFLSKLCWIKTKRRQINLLFQHNTIIFTNYIESNAKHNLKLGLVSASVSLCAVASSTATCPSWPWPSSRRARLRSPDLPTTPSPGGELFSLSR